MTRSDIGEIRLTIPVQFGGRVTAEWIMAAADCWLSCMKRCERFLRRRGVTDANPAVPHGATAQFHQAPGTVSL